MAVGVLIPWRGGCPHREAAFAWVLNRYKQHRYNVTVGSAPDGAWCKALAVADAIARSTADQLVIADADVWCDDLPQAVEAVEQGAGWAVPHRLVHRLTEEATALVLAGSDLGGDTAERPYKGRAGGGIVVLHRSTYQQVPLDPRFQGWGHEDDSWAAALSTLAGPAWRGTADLFHLWHPPQARVDRGTGSKESHDRWVQYRRARKNPAAMQAILQEVT